MRSKVSGTYNEGVFAPDGLFPVNNPGWVPAELPPANRPLATIVFLATGALDS